MDRPLQEQRACRKSGSKCYLTQLKDPKTWIQKVGFWGLRFRDHERSIGSQIRGSTRWILPEGLGERSEPTCLRRRFGGRELLQGFRKVLGGLHSIL